MASASVLVGGFEAYRCMRELLERMRGKGCFVQGGGVRRLAERAQGVYEVERFVEIYLGSSKVCPGSFWLLPSPPPFWCVAFCCSACED